MDDKLYFDWLMTRSLKGYFYRRIFLYPKLKRLLMYPAADVGCGIGDFLKFCKEYSPMVGNL